MEGGLVKPEVMIVIKSGEEVLHNRDFLVMMKVVQS